MENSKNRCTRQEYNPGASSRNRMQRREEAKQDNWGNWAFSSYKPHKDHKRVIKEERS